MSEYNRKKQSTLNATGELLADKVVRAFISSCFDLATSRRNIA